MSYKYIAINERNKIEVLNNFPILTYSLYTFTILQDFIPINSIF